jgi:hypothetical protein
MPEIAVVGLERTFNARPLTVAFRSDEIRNDYEPSASFRVADNLKWAD